MAESSKWVAELSADELRSVLARVKAKARAEGPAPIRPRPAADPASRLPLSFAQERLWFVDRLTPGLPVYNIPAALRLRGALGSGGKRALAASLAAIVRRHEVLRTVFAEDDGQPVQVVLPAAPEPPARMPEVDLGALPDPRRAARPAAEDEVRRPFDLASGPLLRAALLRIGEADHLLVLTVHHIAADGWSVDLLFSELAALYAAFATGKPSPLPPLPVQYADYALWQRRWLAGEVLMAQLAWWRDRLGPQPEPPPPLELPLDRPRRQTQGHRGAVIRFDLPVERVQVLRALARTEGCSLYVTLLAAFGAFLARVARQDDLIIGSPVANRNRKELEPLVGFFVNTLPLRIRIEPEASFRALLTAVRDTVLAAWAHQDVPFERLVQELLPQRDPSRPPLAQVSLVLQEGGRTPQLPGLATELVPLHTGTAKLDLSLGLRECNGRLEGAAELASELFDRSTIARFLSHFRNLLTAVTAAPETRVAETPILSAVEARQLLAASTGPQGLPWLSSSLSRLVAAQAERRGPEIAVEWESGEMSYRELAAAVRRLAGRLRQLDLGPEAIVALFLPRSPEMVVGVLGVLAAGAAYLPLDPDFPRERLSAMWEDAQPAALITLPGWAAAELPGAPPVVVAVELEGGLDESGADGPPPPRPELTNLANVLYTSGSTGRPKGVATPQLGLTNRLLWGQHVYQLQPGDAVLQLAAFGFDFAAWEILAPLIAGARLVLARPGGHRDTAYLVRTIVDRRVTHVHFVPSLLELFLDEAGVAGCAASLRRVLVGGEALSTALRDRFFSVFSIPLTNQYGPTEAAIDAVWHSMDPEVRRLDGIPVPIGRPIHFCSAYVLTPAMHLAPFGVAGELCLGGVCLARGYLGRPDLTAERFIPDPFGAGERLYRTGDLARRRRTGGDLEYLGRIDQQVKVRGVRIEPAEIEGALLRHPHLREAAVVVAAGPGGLTDRRLVACFVADPPAPDGRELRSLLASVLPEAMLPALYLPCEVLPRTPSGKIDRAALSRLGATAMTAPQGATVAPHTPSEELLAAIWADLLGVERVGVEDDFFALGGHSLLAVRVAARVRDAFGVELPLGALFTAPTVSALAAYLDGLRAADLGAARPPLRPVDAAARAAGLPLSFAQERLWFLAQMDAESAAYNVASATLWRGPLDPAALAAAFSAVRRRHEALRTVFSLVAGEPRQRVLPPSAVPLPVADLSSLPGDLRRCEAARIAAGEMARPFNLARGPLLRAGLLRLGGDEHVLLATQHHIVSDAWSAGLLIREIAALYPCCTAGRPSPLPGLAVQYADFAVWQRQWLRGEVLAGALSWWRERLAGAPETLDIPTDRPRPAVQSGRGRQHPIALGAELTRALRGLARRRGTTLFMTLFAGLSALLSRYTRQQDLLVGAPAANRDQRELEGLIGFFVNTLVLRARLEDDPDFAGLLARVRQASLGAYEHQHLPFEKLVEELRPGRSLARSPLVQALFALQNAPEERLEIPGLEVAALPDETATAKLDLSVILRDAGGEIAGAIEYATDLFDRGTIARFSGHFVHLLAGAAAAPDSPVSDLPLVSDAERAEILLAATPPSPAYPRDVSIPELFAAQARRTPGAPALEFPDADLTYAELARRAGRLAACLGRLGVGAEALVGLAVEPSAAMVVGMLGILQSGAAYVPLDLTYPQERLAWMAADAGLAALVARRGWEGRPGLPTVSLDDLAAGDAADLPHRDPALAGDSLAYLIYTSGSTGNPKAVAVSHRAIARLVLATDYAPLTSDDRVAQASNAAFDAVTFEVWGALLNGACVVGIERDEALSPAELSRALRERRISTLFLTTALFNQVIREDPGAFGSLRFLLFGGEAVDPRVVRQALRQPPERLLHVYGPTESTTFATWHQVEAVPEEAFTVPIGRPIAHTEGFVVEAPFGLAPAGVPGELLLGGDGLARGYWRRPDLTAERFVPHPWSRRPGERLYRTGDLVRRTAAGIEFLGRIDQQVKIRGFRIEPGEIEAALCAHPLVAAAAVQAREGQPGERHLVAYVVPSEPAAPESRALRAFLRQRLPEFMVPAAFVMLPMLPLNPNGKLDRSALPAPAGAAGEDAPPRSALEEIVAGLWSEVLGTARISIHDDFFDLGGHSLLAVRLVARMRDTLGVELTVRSIFDAPTVAQLAERVALELTDKAGEALLEQVFSEGDDTQSASAQQESRHG